MKFLSLPIHQNGTTYFLEPFTGNLLSKEIETHKTPKVLKCEKISIALKHCDNPYLLRSEKINSKAISTSPYLKYFGNRLTKASKVAFCLARAITILGKPVFNSTSHAILAYRKFYPTEKQQDLCLPRTLFAASTSKSFKEKGVIFIGVFLPSRNMHAWIIEDGVQPDPYDTMWVNYQPVAILY
jgi:hypothetical protein